MQQLTLDAVRAILRADSTLTDTARADVLRRLTGSPNAPTGGPRLLRLAQVADRLSCSRRSVGNLIAQGVLRAVRLPGRKRCLGVPEAEVVRLLEVQDVPRRRRVS